VETKYYIKFLCYSNRNKIESSCNGILEMSTRSIISWQMIKYSGKCTRNFSCSVRVMKQIICTGTLRTLKFHWVTYMDENIRRFNWGR
jgi:hypothetical protein